MRYVTICYLLRETPDGTEVCLAPKLKKHVAGNLNGAGGHLENNETAAEAAIREIAEEQRVIVEESALEPIGLVSFVFPNGTREPMYCQLFATQQWCGTPEATDEMGDPEWHLVRQLPFDRLPESDLVWLYLALTHRLKVATVWLRPDYSLISAVVSTRT